MSPDAHVIMDAIQEKGVGSEVLGALISHQLGQRGYTLEIGECVVEYVTTIPTRVPYGSLYTADAPPWDFSPPLAVSPEQEALDKAFLLDITARCRVVGYGQAGFQGTTRPRSP